MKQVGYRTIKQGHINIQRSTTSRRLLQLFLDPRLEASERRKDDERQPRRDAGGEDGGGVPLHDEAHQEGQRLRADHVAEANEARDPRRHRQDVLEDEQGEGEQGPRADPQDGHTDLDPGELYEFIYYGTYIE